MTRNIWGFAHTVPHRIVLKRHDTYFYDEAF